MSEGIRLSHEMIDGVMAAIVAHDPQVEENGTVGLQYLAAIMGVLAADYPGSDSDRQELLEHLAAFTRHVHDDQLRSRQQQEQQQQQPQAAGGHCETDAENPATGVWRADKS